MQKICEEIIAQADKAAAQHRTGIAKTLRAAHNMAYTFAAHIQYIKELQDMRNRIVENVKNGVYTREEGREVYNRNKAEFSNAINWAYDDLTTAGYEEALKAKEWKTQWEESQDELASLRAEKTELETTLADLKRALAIREEMAMDYSRKYANCKQSYDDQQAVMEGLRELNAELERKVAFLSNRTTALQATLDSHLGREI